MNFINNQLIADKVAQLIAKSVQHMAINEDWLKPATIYEGKKITLLATVLNQPLQLSWLVSEKQILKAIPVEESTSELSLTLLPSIYNALAEQPFDLNRVMRHVRIEGDVGLAEWFNSLVQQLRPNIWEDISRLIGDIPATYIEQVATYGLKQLKQSTNNLAQQAQYALLDESPILVRHEHLNELIHNTQDVRYQLDRLEQRLALLKKVENA